MNQRCERAVGVNIEVGVQSERQGSNQKTRLPQSAKSGAMRRTFPHDLLAKAANEPNLNSQAKKTTVLSSGDANSMVEARTWRHWKSFAFFGGEVRASSNVPSLHLQSSQQTLVT